MERDPHSLPRLARLLAEYMRPFPCVGNNCLNIADGQLDYLRRYWGSRDNCPEASMLRAALARRHDRPTDQKG